MRRLLLFILFLPFLSCNRASPPTPAAEPVPYLGTLMEDSLPAEETEKYRPVFTSDTLLNAISIDVFTPFPEWKEEEQKELLRKIIHYEKTGGESMPPLEGECTLDGEKKCYTMRNRAIGGNPVSEMNLDAAFQRHLALSFIAWSLYLEANQKLPWSILNYSEESLKLLFYNGGATQPRLGTQTFGADFDITENYKIVRGLLREKGDTERDLVGKSALETLINLHQFLGKRIVHFRGGASNTLGPDSGHWPYRNRKDEGEWMDRYPTPSELLLFRDPHRNLVRDPDAPFKAKYHIVNGCWGGSQLLRSLFHSVNLPVELKGNYFNFSGHSGVSFHEIDGRNYLLQHSDNLYFFAWTTGLLDVSVDITAQENWANVDFSPFSNYMNGYTVLHTEKKLPSNRNAMLAQLGIEGDNVALFNAGLGEDFNTDFEFDLRILGLRSLEHLSPVNLFMHCEAPGLERNYLPLHYLTDQEKARLFQKLDISLAQIREERGDGLSCLEFFEEDLEPLYKEKTGLSLYEDEDADGIPNSRDCRPFKPDPVPCPASDLPKILF